MTIPNRSARTLPADLARLDRETSRLLATVEALTPEQLAGPSRCEGWSRAHVVAHLAGNADALGNLIGWAVTGVEQAMYVSVQARNDAIDAGARLDAGELKALLGDAVRRFRDGAARLTGPLKAPEVALRDWPLNAYALLVPRITEVIVHHGDLDAGWTLADAGPDALDDAIAMALYRLDAAGESSAPGAGLRLSTGDGAAWRTGDGTTSVHGPRHCLVAWLARGEPEGLTFSGARPELPSW
ncbi:MAG: maleylpyruvate isomerase family mycothiol-dependent enzyme [Kineosporiaceae bacterium]